MARLVGNIVAVCGSGIGRDRRAGGRQAIPDIGPAHERVARTRNLVGGRALDG